MGITNNCAKFLKHVGSQAVDFSTTLMLGRQQLYISPKTLANLFDKATCDKVASSRYAEPFFEALGAKRVDSLDYSDYEEATLIYDLNKPLPADLRSRYSVVFDGGTLEHVFNFPVAVKNCMELLRVGGHFVSITPCNNQCGHGLYQFSPELFYSVFSQKHGFTVMLMYLAVETTPDEREWYEVANPQVVKSRVVFKNANPTYLMVVARKEFEFIGELNAYQSDYQEIWATNKEPQTPAGVLVRLYKILIPGFIRAWIYRLRHSNKQITTKNIGKVNAQHFKRVTID
jgi:SAM-dependent methyltransferase